MKTGNDAVCFGWCLSFPLALPFSPLSPPFHSSCSWFVITPHPHGGGKAPDRLEGLRWIHGGWVERTSVPPLINLGDQWVICLLSQSRASGEAANQWLSRSRTSRVQYKVINASLASLYGWTRVQDQCRVPVAPWPEPDRVGSMQRGSVSILLDMINETMWQIP